MQLHIVPVDTIIFSIVIIVMVVIIIITKVTIIITIPTVNMVIIITVNGDHHPMTPFSSLLTVYFLWGLVIYISVSSSSAFLWCLAIYFG